MHPSKLRITPLQLAMLLIPGIASTAILGLPAVTVTFARQDAWLAPLAAAPAAALVIWIAGRLAQRFPGETFIEYAPRVLGTVPGKIAGFLLFWYFFHLDAAIAREYADFLIATTIPRTPLAAILAISALVTGLAVRYGPEILGRLGELFTPGAIVTVLLVIALTAPQMDLHLLQPSLEYGIQPVLTAALATQAFMGQFVLLLVLLPSVNRLSDGIRASYWALAAIAFAVTLVTLAALAAFGPMASRFTWPFLKVARIATIGPIVARIDPLVIALWIGGCNLKIAVHLYAATVCFAQLFGLRDYRPLVLPMAALLAAYAVGHFENFVEHGYMLTYFWPPYTQLFHLVIPGMVLAVAAARRMGVRQR